MANTPPTLASAVVVPDADDQPSLSPTAPAIKRRQSSPPEHNDGSTKRARRSIEQGAQDASPTAGSPPIDNERASRRQSTQQEEKKRGRRLFGGVLKTLSQNNTSRVQTQRRDIDRKQQAKLKEQREELEKQRQERLERLNQTRRRAQYDWDRQAMDTRHSNMSATAKFLRTETEPVLYYMPFELSADQRATIDAQLDEVDAVIEREREEFEDRMALMREEDDREDEERNGHANGTDSELLVKTHREQDQAQVQAESSHPTNGEANNDSDMQVDKPKEEGGQSMELDKPVADDVKPSHEDPEEIVVEAGEDTVIY